MDLGQYAVSQRVAALKRLNRAVRKLGAGHLATLLCDLFGVNHAGPLTNFYLLHVKAFFFEKIYQLLALSFTIFMAFQSYGGKSPGGFETMPRQIFQTQHLRSQL